MLLYFFCFFFAYAHAKRVRQVPCERVTTVPCACDHLIHCFPVEGHILFLLAFPLSSVKLLLMNVGQKATLLTFQLMLNQVKKRFMETIYFQVFILYSTVTRLFPS